MRYQISVGQLLRYLRRLHNGYVDVNGIPLLPGDLVHCSTHRLGRTVSYKLRLVTRSQRGHLKGFVVAYLAGEDKREWQHFSYPTPLWWWCPNLELTLSAAIVRLRELDVEVTYA